jgi:hypothetical protein
VINDSINDSIKYTGKEIEKNTSDTVKLCKNMADSLDAIKRK